MSFYGIEDNVSNQAKAEKQLDDDMKPDRIAGIKQKLINDPDVMYQAIDSAIMPPFDDDKLVLGMQNYFNTDRAEAQHVFMNSFFSTLVKRIDDYLEDKAEEQAED